MTLRQVFERGESTIGGWCVIPSPFSAELMGRAGFDWVCIDTQHGLIGYDTMAVMLEALAGTATPSFVRVPWNEPEPIMKALDAGAEGVVIPMVNSREEAERAVGACRYPPAGYRSWGPVRAALGVSGYTPESANRRTVVAVMIETRAGVAAADDILSVPGVDAVYVGPNDLAISYGFSPSGDPTEPEHVAAIESIAAAARRHGVTAGIHCGSPETAERWRSIGFRMLNVNSDAVFLRGTAQGVAQRLGGDLQPSDAKSSYA